MRLVNESNAELCVMQRNDAVQQLCLVTIHAGKN